MKIIDGLMLGVLLLSGETISQAQQSPITLAEPQLEASVAAKPNFSVGKLSLESSYSSSLSQPEPPSDSYGTGVIGLARPVVSSKVLDRKYYLLNGLHLGMGLLDVGLTQRCMANHQCVEGNPLMPSSLAGQLSVNLGYVGYAAFMTYNLKKRHSRLWWVSPSSGIATHSFGAATGLMH